MNEQEVQMYYNAYTQKHYEGKNVEILKSTGLTGGFMTFNQAYKLGSPCNTINTVVNNKHSF